MGKLILFCIVIVALVLLYSWGKDFIQTASEQAEKESERADRRIDGMLGVVEAVNEAADAASGTGNTIPLNRARALATETAE